LQGTILNFSAIVNFGSAQKETLLPLFALSFSGVGGINNLTIKNVDLIFPKIFFNLNNNIQNVSCVATQTNIGPINDPQILALLIQNLAQNILIPILNDILALEGGIPFPTSVGKTITILGPILEVVANSIIIGMDFLFS
jgi:hypothetical protein